jgi:ADP-ribose pyrophosphatase YjhB (NUDIX family)
MPKLPFAQQLLHRYYRVSRGLTLGVRGLVVDAAERVFLVRHSYVAGWHLPGGGVEPGETAQAALSRELAEEGNLVVTGPLRLHGLFFNRKVSNRDHVAVFHVASFRQTGVKTADMEILEADFFARDRLPETTTPATLRRLAEVFDGAPIGTDW